MRALQRTHLPITSTRRSSGCSVTLPGVRRVTAASNGTSQRELRSWQCPGRPLGNVAMSTEEPGPTPGHVHNGVSDTTKVVPFVSTHEDDGTLGEIERWACDVAVASQDAVGEPDPASPDGSPLPGINAQAWVNRLQPQHLDHLRASGLNDNTIAKAKLRSITDPEEARALLRWMPGRSAPSVPALSIPYGDGSYSRLRPDVPRKDKDGRKIKYDAPAGVPFQIYIPDAVAPSIRDRAVELWITEGEKKALAGCQAGLPTVAVSGVSCFHDKAARDKVKAGGHAEWALHPQLASLVVPPTAADPKRHVTVVFDSDIDDKHEIQHAAARAIEMLRRAQAVVHIAFIERDPSGDKVGVDDLYVRLGAELRLTLESSKRPAEATKL